MTCSTSIYAFCSSFQVRGMRQRPAPGDMSAASRNHHVSQTKLTHHCVFVFHLTSVEINYTTGADTFPNLEPFSLEGNRVLLCLLVQTSIDIAYHRCEHLVKKSP